MLDKWLVHLPLSSQVVVSDPGSNLHVWSRHFLLCASVFLFCFFSGFLPLHKTHFRFIEDSKLSLAVNLSANDCLIVYPYVPCHWLCLSCLSLSLTSRVPFQPVFPPLTHQIQMIRITIRLLQSLQVR